MNTEKGYLNLVAHYEGCLERYGDTPQGVDWPNPTDALTRYGVMLDLLKLKEGRKYTLLDFGCGASHLYEYLLRQTFHRDIVYNGLDISEKFIQLSKKKYPNNQYYTLDILTQAQQLPVFDYVIMNGVFTEKLNLSFDEMFSFTQRMLIETFKKTQQGLAFNVMSKAVDWERDDLFHLSTDVLIGFLTKNLSRNFIIRNDYGLYEYTVYLYK